MISGKQIFRQLLWLSAYFPERTERNNLASHLCPLKSFFAVNHAKTVLVVCHYLTVLNAAEAALQAAGYRVICEHSVDRSLRHLLEEKIEAVVLCSSLPPALRRDLESIARRLNVPVMPLPVGRPEALQELLNALSADDDLGKVA